MSILELFRTCDNLTIATRFVVLRKWKDERDHSDLIFDGNYIDMSHNVYVKKIKHFTLVMEKDIVVVIV